MASVLTVKIEETEETVACEVNADIQEGVSPEENDVANGMYEIICFLVAYHEPGSKGWNLKRDIAIAANAYMHIGEDGKDD